MRRAILLVLFAAVLIVLYWIWPIWGAYQIAQAVRAADPAQIAERTDFNRLRRSLAAQITESYIALYGPAKKLSPLERSLATALGGGAVERLLREMLTPNTLAQFLREGRADQFLPKDGGSDFRLPGLTEISRLRVMDVFSRYHFEGPLTVEVALRDGFSVDLRLSGLTWRLSGIGVPTAVREQLARRVQAREQKPQ